MIYINLTYKNNKHISIRILTICIFYETLTYIMIYAYNIYHFYISTLIYISLYYVALDLDFLKKYYGLSAMGTI